MSTDAEIQSEALVLLSRQFGPEPDDEERPSAARLSMEEVRRYVVQQVSRLLNENPALLMSILYRVDVAETDVQNVLAYTRPSDIPAELADLLIHRQIQKIKIRRTYRGKE
ncbi:MAG TPA: hypothetical protein VFG50_17710 [Rhodothermales bacterium]|nr:hypothetical protein [Rhodothermales bacterium]